MPTSSFAHQGWLCTVSGVMLTACPQNEGRVWALKGAIRQLCEHLDLVSGAVMSGVLNSL